MLYESFVGRLFPISEPESELEFCRSLQNLASKMLLKYNILTIPIWNHVSILYKKHNVLYQ